MGAAVSAPEYRIAKLADFLAVPAEKQAECLRDFEMWLQMAREQTAVNQIMSDMLGGVVKFNVEYFTWCDDGISGLSSIDFHEDGGNRSMRIDFQERTP